MIQLANLDARFVITFRQATPDDTAACITIRGKTRENAVSAERLMALGITQEYWSHHTRSISASGLAQYLQIRRCSG